MCHVIRDMRKIVPEGYVACFRNRQMESLQSLTFFFNILQCIENCKNLDEVCEKRQFAYLSF